MTEFNPPPPSSSPSPPPRSGGYPPIPPQQPARPYPAGPQIIFQPPPARRSRNLGWKIATVLLVLILLCSLGANFLGLLIMGLRGAASASSSANIQEETLRAGGSDKVAILPVLGEIDDTMADRVRRFCQAVRDDSAIRAVVVHVDSPGGSVTSSDEIHHMFTQLAHDGQRTLVVSMGSMAASGGYYICMPAEKIYAEPTTLTGSIGVIWPAFEASDLLKKIGITPEIITSTEAVHKDTGSFLRKFTDADRTRILALVNDAHAKFRAIVAAGRAGKLTVPMTQIATGDIWPADQARTLGLIDGIAYLDEVCTAAARDAGIGNPTIVRLRESHSLFDVLGGAGAAATPNNAQVHVDLDPKKVLSELETPRLEYRFVP